jgi:hypothetical protein
MKLTKIMAVALLLLVSVTRVGWCGGDQESATIVALQKTYFKAIQSNDFSTAYDMVTDKMKDDRTREQYVADWKAAMTMGQVDIIKGGVTTIEVDGDKARVHAWTSMSDLFNLAPIFENEIDHWLLVEGVWKLDLTEVLMEEVTEMPSSISSY